MKYNSLSELFAAIADSIRGKTGGTDPIVANDFPTAIEGISSVSVVDDGYFIEWDGSTEGRDMISVMGMLTLYKVSNVVFDTTKLTGVMLWNVTAGSNDPFEFTGTVNAAGGDGWCAVMDGTMTIYVISGVAGTHTFQGIDVVIPSDGTYFLSYAVGSTRRIAKPAAA